MANQRTVNHLSDRREEAREALKAERVAHEDTQKQLDELIRERRGQEVDAANLQRTITALNEQMGKQREVDAGRIRALEVVIENLRCDIGGLEEQRDDLISTAGVLARTAR